jgi:hypothetical protein
MTDDIVTRLRDLISWNNCSWPEVASDAADEIERLRAALKADAQTLRLHLGEMTAQEMRTVQAAFAWVLAEKHVAGAGEKVTALGYEHLAPEAVQAIRDTCSTPASRVGKTQAEVFKNEGTP